MVRIELLKKSFLLYDTGKLCSEVDENRSTNSVTILSTDAGQTDGRLRDFVFCAMLLVTSLVASTKLINAGPG